MSSDRFGEKNNTEIKIHAKQSEWKTVVLQISGMKEDLMERKGPSQGAITIQRRFEIITYSLQELLIVHVHTILCWCIITVTFGRQWNSILYNSDDKKLTVYQKLKAGAVLWSQNGSGQCHGIKNSPCMPNYFKDWADVSGCYLTIFHSTSDTSTSLSIPTVFAIYYWICLSSLQNYFKLQNKWVSKP